MGIKGMGKFLNNATLSANNQSLKVIDIDINKIHSNTNNFYGIRDIEELASMIATSNYVEPLEVVEDNGEYRLIAGHRRRAAVLHLIEQGARESTEVPCIVRSFDNENDLDLSVDEIEIINLIFSNRGQRRNITPKERLEEIQRLEPIARKIFNSEKYKEENGGKRGSFRAFFANSILDISDAELGRLKSLERLSPKAMEAMDKGLINKSIAVNLSSLTPEEQDSYIENFEDEYSINSVEEFKASLGSDEPFESPAEDDDFNYDDFDDPPSDDDSSDDESGDEPSYNNANDSADEPTTEASPSNISVSSNLTTTTASDEKLVEASKEAKAEDQEATKWVITKLSNLSSEIDKEIQHEKDMNNNVEASKWDCRKAKLNLVISLLEEG